MGVRSGSGRLRIELRTGPCSRSEAAVARSGQLAVSGPGASGERGAIRNSFRCPACLLRALLCLARASGILCPSLAENHYLAGSSFWRAGRVSDAVPCRRHGRTFPGSPRRCRLGVAANRKGVRPGLPVGVRLRGATVGRRGPDVRKLRRRNRLTVGRAVDRMVDVDGRMRSLRLRAWIVWRSDCLALTGGYGLRRIGRLAVWVKGARGGCFRTKQ